MENRQDRYEVTTSDTVSKVKKPWKRGFFYALFISGSLLLLTVLAVGVYLIYFFYFREVPPPPETRLVRQHVKHGDIILRSGVGLWSELFRSRNTHDERFSHVGIVMIEPDGQYFVLHSEGNDITGKGSVYISTLDDFVQESELIGIARLKTIDPALFVENAKTFLGRPFDHYFDRSETDAIYCTELIDLALRKTAPGTALKVTDDVILPEACLDETLFTEIPIRN